MSELQMWRMVSRGRSRPFKVSNSDAVNGLPWKKPLMVLRLPLVPGAQNAYCINWQNPEPYPLLVMMVILNITVAGVATSDIDLGPAAASVTHDDTLLDGAPLDGLGWVNNYDALAGNGRATGIIDENGGTNGWLCGQIITAAGTNLAGWLYVVYTPIDY